MASSNRLLVWDTVQTSSKRTSFTSSQVAPQTGPRTHSAQCRQSGRNLDQVHQAAQTRPTSPESTQARPVQPQTRKEVCPSRAWTSIRAPRTAKNAWVAIDSETIESIWAMSIYQTMSIVPQMVAVQADLLHTVPPMAAKVKTLFASICSLRKQSAKERARTAPLWMVVWPRSSTTVRCFSPLIAQMGIPRKLRTIIKSVSPDRHSSLALLPLRRWSRLTYSVRGS